MYIAELATFGPRDHDHSPQESTLEGMSVSGDDRGESIEDVEYVNLVVPGAVGSTLVSRALQRR